MKLCITGVRGNDSFLHFLSCGHYLFNFIYTLPLFPVGTQSSLCSCHHLHLSSQVRLGWGMWLAEGQPSSSPVLCKSTEEWNKLSRRAGKFFFAYFCTKGHITDYVYSEDKPFGSGSRCWGPLNLSHHFPGRNKQQVMPPSYYILSVCAGDTYNMYTCLFPHPQTKRIALPPHPRWYSENSTKGKRKITFPSYSTYPNPNHDPPRCFNGIGI